MTSTPEPGRSRPGHWRAISIAASKLAAATTLWLGFGLTLPYVVYAGIAGGVLTLAILMLRRLPRTAFIAGHAWLERLHNAKSGVPYGIALAAAGLLTYSNSAIYERLVG